MKNTKKQTSILFAVLLLLPLMSSLFVMTPKASAATITVTTTASEDNDPGPDTGCSLFEAIEASNTDMAYGGCIAGNGLDTINVPAGTYDLTGRDYILTAEATVLGDAAGGTIFTNNTFSIANDSSDQTYLIRNITFTDSVSHGFVFFGSQTTGYSVTLDRITSRNNDEMGIVHDRSTDATGQLYITNSLIENNGGYGLYNYECGSAGSVYVTNSMIRGNGDTGVYNLCGFVSLNQVTISGNSSTTTAAGVYNDDELEMINVTIFGNTSTATTGGLYAGSDVTSLTNVTIAYNNSTQDGGIGGNGSLSVDNTLVANNQGRQCADGTENTIDAGTNNMATDDTCSFYIDDYFQVVSDAKIASSLADNGGSAPIGSGGLGGNVLTLALLDGSPAMNAGNNDYCPATDERDAGRPFGATCDIGAFEAQFASTITGDATVATPATALAETGQGTTIIAVLSAVVVGLAVLGGRYTLQKFRQI